jgi:hypothetical protein
LYEKNVFLFSPQILYEKNVFLFSPQISYKIFFFILSTNFVWKNVFSLHKFCMKKMCVSNFSTNFDRKIFHSKKNRVRSTLVFM